MGYLLQRWLWLDKPTRASDLATLYDHLLTQLSQPQLARTSNNRPQPQ